MAKYKNSLYPRTKCLTTATKLVSKRGSHLLIAVRSSKHFDNMQIYKYLFTYRSAALEDVLPGALAISIAAMSYSALLLSKIQVKSTNLVDSSCIGFFGKGRFAKSHETFSSRPQNS